MVLKSEERLKALENFKKSDQFLYMLQGFNLKVSDFTCEQCERVFKCDCAYDPYSTHGDCLWIK